MDEEALWALDRSGMVAWPALREERLGGWILRFSNGLYGRSNSVQPYSHPGCGLEEAIDRCEVAYQSHGLPLVFRVSEIGGYDALESLLAARGYVREDDSFVMTAPLPAPGNGGASADLGDITENWLASYYDLNRRTRGREDLARAILGLLPTPRRAASIEREGHTASIGVAAKDAETLWIFAMRTHPASLREGFARNVLHSLLQWGASSGAERAALHVQADSAPALALYEKAGFKSAYRYHYRCASVR